MAKYESNIKIYKLSEIQKKIYTIRHRQMVLDRDLADIYGVETKVFNPAVKRNLNRFPDDFRFQLTGERI